MCPYFDLCGGGAPRRNILKNGGFAASETNYCRHVVKLPIDIVFQDLEQCLVAAKLTEPVTA